jgi:hypothetical protein
MGTLDDEISRQRRAERTREDSHREQEASMRPSANLEQAIADFLAKDVPPTGEYPTGGTTELSRFFGSEGVTESGWVLSYRVHDDVPGAPNVLLTAAGDIRASAGFGDPFLPLSVGDGELCGFPSTGDPSTARMSTLVPGTGDFDDFLIDALAGLVRSNGATTGAIDH